MTLDGEAIESQYGGPQRKYMTTERDVFYVSEPVGKIIAETCSKLKIEEREPVVICKAEVPDGRDRKAIRWQVTRVNAPVPLVGPQPDSGFAVQRTPTANTALSGFQKYIMERTRLSSWRRTAAIAWCRRRRRFRPKCRRLFSPAIFPASRQPA
jgi:hypothetical protein